MDLWESSDDNLIDRESDDDILVEAAMDVVGSVAMAEERPRAPFVLALPSPRGSASGFSASQGGLLSPLLAGEGGPAPSPVGRGWAEGAGAAAGWRPGEAAG
jgi:hypothetical protein